jgi:hypothetical protein
MNFLHVYATSYRNVEIRDTCRPVSPLVVLIRESLTWGSINLSVRRAYVTIDGRQGITSLTCVLFSQSRNRDGNYSHRYWPLYIFTKLVHSTALL